MRTLVLGLGNPVLRDDSVGIRTVRLLKSHINNPDIEIGESSLGGLDFIDLLSGYGRVILVDAMKTASVRPGTVKKFCLWDAPPGERLVSSHGVDLATAVRLGRTLGADIPEKIEIVAIEVEDNTSFGEDMTPRVEQAIPRALDAVLGLLGKSVHA